jgi:hypothetical protein
MMSQNERLIELLSIIATWKLPKTGETWPDGRPRSYESKHGSRGVEAYMKKIAQEALDVLKVEPFSEEAIRLEWKNAGGSVHGPKVETVTMSETEYFKFRRSLNFPPIAKANWKSGWQLVPIDWTPEMRDAWNKACDRDQSHGPVRSWFVADGWRAVLAVVGEPQPSQDETEYVLRGGNRAHLMESIAELRRGELISPKMRIKELINAGNDLLATHNLMMRDVNHGASCYQSDTIRAMNENPGKWTAVYQRTMHEMQIQLDEKKEG